MGSVVILIGFALYAATLFVLRAWVDAIPARLWAIVMHERERTDRKELDTLQEATARKVGALTKSIRDYQEQIAADFRAQMASAEARARTAEASARVAERGATETKSVLDAAYLLLGDVKATHDGLGELPPIVAELRALLGKAGLTKPATAPEADDETRKTVETSSRSGAAPPPASTGEEGDANEETRVIAPALGALRVPDRRPPPVPRSPLTPAREEEPHEGDQHGYMLPPAPETKEKKS